MAEFELDDEEADKYAGDLIRTRILISELQPNVIGCDYLHRIMDSDASNPVSLQLHKLAGDMDAINLSSDLGERIRMANEIGSDLNRDFKVKCNSKYMLQLDSFCKSEGLSISHKTVSQVLEAPQKVANSQRVSDLLFIHTPPGHHKSHHTHANALKYCALVASAWTQIYSCGSLML